MSVRSLNKVMLIGNLTRDPELRFTANGTPVATFSLATNKSWRDANGDLQESAQFHNIVAWGKMAEICQQILAKGMLTYVEGELVTRSWDGEDGVTRYKTEVKIAEMKLLDGKGKQGSGADGASAKKSENGDESEKVKDSEVPEEVLEDEDPTKMEDDLPF